jgi:O-acetyl-ADP-ribose deacetylase (regulator of RNase III)
LLCAAFRSSLRLAVETGLESIAFPAISCGAYGYPIDEAAAISAKVVREQEWDLREIRFVLYADEILAAWNRAFA